MNEILKGGVIADIAEGVRRLIAPNAGMMTGPGTNTYLLGSSELAVIDPGPSIDRHIEAIQVLAGAPITRVLVTHTHPDHSPAARKLAAQTGAATIGMPPPPGRHQDRTFIPDVVPADGEPIDCGDFELIALHTPGHASNHFCYLQSRHEILFTGDHIINGSTVVIDPPDGDMTHYLQSLSRLKDLAIDAIAPGHGAVFDKPFEVIDWIIDHRLKRESAVFSAVATHPDSTPAELVQQVYTDVDPKLHDLAERSLLAHLYKLQSDRRVAEQQERWRSI